MERRQKQHKTESNDGTRYSKVCFWQVIEILKEQRLIWERVQKLAAIEKMNREREQDLAAMEKLHRKAARAPFLMFVLRSCSFESQ